MLTSKEIRYIKIYCPFLCLRGKEPEVVVEGRTNCLRSVGVDTGVKGWIQQNKTSMPGIWAWDVAPELNFRQSPISHFPSPPFGFTLSLHLLLNMQNTFHRGILPTMGVGLRVALCLTLTESPRSRKRRLFLWASLKFVSGKSQSQGLF